MITLIKMLGKHKDDEASTALTILFKVKIFLL